MKKRNKYTKARPLVAFKGFYKGYECRDYKFKIGEVHSIPRSRKIKICNTGFHACEKPSHVLRYYSLYNGMGGFRESIVFALVHQWGEVKGHIERDRHASRHIKVVKRISHKKMEKLIQLERTMAWDGKTKKQILEALHASL